MAWICLMYHDVLPTAPVGGGGPMRFAVPVRSFERMLDAISATGARGCSIEEAMRERGHRVAISFDDGTSSQRDHAMPALQARGMTATFFVTTDWIGRPGFMSWGDLRELVARGMSVQSHTKSHPFLSELDEPSLVDELVGSKAALDSALGQVTDQLSLPGGNAPRRGLWHLVNEAGYRVVAGSRWGHNPDGVSHSVERSLLRRCSMSGELTESHAKRVLAGDPRLAIRKSGREAGLNALRASLGASRYARWRRYILDTLARREAGWRGG